jgi:hypothetical protein
MDGTGRSPPSQLLRVDAGNSLVHAAAHVPMLIPLWQSFAALRAPLLHNASSPAAVKAPTGTVRPSARQGALPCWEFGTTNRQTKGTREGRSPLLMGEFAMARGATGMQRKRGLKAQMPRRIYVFLVAKNRG